VQDDRKVVEMVDMDEEMVRLAMEAELHRKAEKKKKESDEMLECIYAVLMTEVSRKQ
jgi:hypothetical protein